MRQIHTAGAACAAKESMATAAAATVIVATAADGEASGGQEGVQQQHDMQQRMSMPAEVRDKERRKHVKSYLHRDGDFTAGW